MSAPAKPYIEPDELTVLGEVGEWALPFLRGDAPRFGSLEWLELPLDDPRRAAAVVRAALSWWRCGEPLEDVERRVQDAQDKLASVGVCRLEDWSTLSRVTPHEEVVHRRRQLPADYREVTVADAQRSWAELESQPERRAAG